MKKLIGILLFIINVSVAYTQDTLYVSPSGSGEIFSRDVPGAVEGLGRKLASIGEPRRNIIVFFQGGLYELEQPLLISSKEKNKNIDTLLLVGSTSGKVILSGGRRVAGWKNAGKGIYKASLAGCAGFRQLYVEGKMAVRARTPNRENEDDYSPYNRIAGFDETSQTVTIKASEATGLENTEGLEIVINHHWYQSRFRLESMEQQGKNILFRPIQPARKHLFQLTYAKMLAAGKPYYFENARSFLDQEKEWFWDKKESVLYYMPPKQEKIEELEIIYPVLDRVLKIEGTAERPIENIRVENIMFGYSNWTIPTRDGIIATQGVQGRGYSGDLETGLIEVEFARNVRIAHCQLTGAGDNGIIFTQGVKNSQISSCHFDQISANGIVIDTYRKGHQTENRLCEKNLIEDNLIENVGMHYTSGMGLIVSFVAKTTIQYNEIRNCRYTGMQIGNHFGDNLSVMRDNVIRRNNIHHVMQLHDDGGAIYTLSLQPGTRIKENWMHDFGKNEWADNFPVNGVFLDNSSGYIRVQDNVFTNLTNVDRIKEQCAGNATTRDNILENNNTQDKEIKDNAGYRGTVGVTIESIR
ncbi:right-handed parallel beta-helix repeat-containing protein [Parabacteroides pacaensis]|uniref:right-handed parallel beta-helix repeat-containing protein n=1 Tax=Parabacteroides pacaensis TaxID=2086575 RepID=UPI001F3B7548|nr:right-handed parallel beta-helix repeat-containing protein [Parabacteroides pacaensis]